MKKKILAILVSLLFVATIPSVIGINYELDNKSSLDIGRCFLKGLLFDLPWGNPNTYFAIWFWYPTEEGMQLIILDWLRVPWWKDSAYLGRFYEISIFGLFIYVFGFFEGGLEVC
jgi:hypothetical protein